MFKFRIAAILAATSGLMSLQQSANAQDSAAGKNAFSQCAACHAVDGTNGAGPSLQGIVGRKSGSSPGFRYSRAMKSTGITWDDNTLDAYLSDPQKVVPGNLMPFSGVADARERADVIAYLKTVK
jgi:cytochrome c